MGKTALEVDPSEGPTPILRPIKATPGSPKGDLPIYLQELIKRLNEMFGDDAPDQDMAKFVNHIADFRWENRDVMAQVNRNTKDQAFKGSLPGAVRAAVVRAMKSNKALAGHLLRQDQRSMEDFTDIIYQLIASGASIDFDGQGKHGG